MALRRSRARRADPFGLERRALSAATAIVDLDPSGSWKTWKFGNTDWQTEAWRLYDIVPEERFLANWIGDSLSQARLYIAELDERGEEIGETTDPEISALAGIPLGTGSQRDDNLRLSGVDLAVGGECWIVGEGAARDPLSAEGAWFVLTGSAVKRKAGKITVSRPKFLGGSTLQLTDGVDILIRCWRPHPNDVNQADSATRAAIVPLREIELLTKREFAELDSRLTGAGVMFLPEGVDFPRGENEANTVGNFMAYLQRSAAASMVDQSTAQAMVPIMATLPDHMIEHIDKLRPLNFWSDLSAEISPMKDKAIARVASSFEIPNEILLGMSTANHWTAWVISEDGIKRIKPYGAILTDALTRGFLRVALAKMGKPNPERYAYALDFSPLAAKPNRLEDALKLRELFLLSDEETVKSGAFDPEQMPTTEQRVIQVLLKAVEIQPDLLRDPAVQAALGLPRIEQVGLPPTAEQNTDGDPDDDPSERQEAPQGGNPSGPPANETRALSVALSARAAELSAVRVAALPSPQSVFNAAAKLAVYRAMELAGGRLTTPAERHGRWRDIPRHELPARVGPITRDKALKVTEGAWNHVGVVADDLGVNAEDLRALLEGYVLELLTRGMPHHDDLLYAALNIANRGNGLAVAA